MAFGGEIILRPRSWRRLLRFGGFATVAALSPSSYGAAARALAVRQIYLTAWTTAIKNGEITEGTNVIATCPRFNEEAFKAFRDEFRGKGPERFPVGQLTPGT